MGVDARFENIISDLRLLGRYARLLRRSDGSLSPSFVFEILFASTLENNGMQLECEINISPYNDSTVDFLYKEPNNDRLCFELLSPEMSNELKRQCAPRKTEIKGIYEYVALLESGHINKYLRPEAQTIRMQEKLLEKVDKFPNPTNNIFSSIVVDCSSFHFGHFDGEDCRMVMFGRTQNPLLKEFWENNPIKGLLDDSNKNRSAKEFRERITSVIFVTEKSIDLLAKAFIVLNECRSKKHLETFWLKLKNNPIFQKLKYVPPAKS